MIPKRMDCWIAGCYEAPVLPLMLTTALNHWKVGLHKGGLCEHCHDNVLGKWTTALELQTLGKVLDKTPGGKGVEGLLGPPYSQKTLPPFQVSRYPHLEKMSKTFVPDRYSILHKVKLHGPN
jgi:hypothetical protein